MPLCDYGCGQEAHYQMKNGKWCCMPNCSQCPEVRRKNSQGIKRAYKEGIRDAKEIYKHTTQTSKDNMAWARGLNRFSHPSIEKQRLIMREKYSSGQMIGTFTGRKHTKETRQQISLSTATTLDERNIKHFKYKHGYYKGIKCDSRYELAFVIYCIDHNIKIQRCTEIFPYEYKENIHHYRPDFIIGDNIIIEIKGRYTDTVNIKLNAVRNIGRKIYLLTSDKLQKVFKYVEQTYNKRMTKNLEDLYDK